jgi:hypothetical protein
LSIGASIALNCHFLQGRTGQLAHIQNPQLIPIHIICIIITYQY